MLEVQPDDNGVLLVVPVGEQGEECYPPASEVLHFFFEVTHFSEFVLGIVYFP